MATGSSTASPVPAAGSFRYKLLFSGTLPVIHHPFFYQAAGLRDDYGMTTFVCDGCGKCCAGYGSFIRIERQLNSRDYYCRYSLSGDLFPVHAEGEYAGEIAERYSDETGSAAEGKKPCPFLCRNKNGAGFVCGIYSTRPPVCREFRCYRMLIYNPEGQLAGRVIGAGQISTTDESLAHVWEEHVAGLPHEHPPGVNDPVWEKKVTAILAKHGFRGDPAE
jgi:uncharacterized protein